MATKNQKLSLLIKIMGIGLLAIIPSCMVIPYMTVHLKALGFSETTIGIYSSLPWAGLLVLSPFVPKLTRRFGLRKIYIVTGLMNICHSAVLLFADSIYIWGVSNFIFGFVWALRWVTTETLINDYAPEGKKGTAIGIYGTLICGFIASGPLLLLATGVDSELPLQLALFFFIASSIVTFFLPKLEYIKEEEHGKEKFWPFVSANALLFFGAFIGGIFENGISAPTILYAISLGVEQKFAATIPAVLSGGTFVTQYLVGTLTDKYRNSNLYLIISSILLGFTIMSFAALLEPYFIYVPTFVWGAFGGGIYTMTLVMLGYKYTGDKLVVANSYLVVFYTIGSLIGPIMGGVILDLVPDYGFPALLLVLSLMILTASARRKRLH